MSEQAAPVAKPTGTPGGEDFPGTEFNMRVKKPKPKAQRRHRRKKVKK